MIKFEWDSGKEKGNIKKHGVSFDEAKSVFYDAFAILYEDSVPDHDEERFILLGRSDCSQSPN